MVLKYENVILHIKKEVSEGNLTVGDPLPSINSICNLFKTARETVVKAYKILKDEGLIESVPGKGFFLIRESVDYKPSIFLMLNSFNPYMEILYNAFKDELGDDYNLDLFFHHNNIDTFRSIILQNKGKYQTFVVKPFLNTEVPVILEQLKDNYVMLLDRDDYCNKGYSYICQDFTNGFYAGLESVIHPIKRYNSISYLRSSKNPHPKKTEDSFIKFCQDYKVPHTTQSDLKATDIVKNRVYIALSDHDILTILQSAKENSWILGQDIGLISYNDNPVNEFLCNGITAISANFSTLGQEAGCCAKNRTAVNKTVKPSLILRESV